MLRYSAHQCANYLFVLPFPDTGCRSHDYQEGRCVKGIDQLDNFVEVVARLKLVLKLAEDLTDLVFDGVGTVSPLFEAFEIGEELPINEVAKVISDKCAVVVKGTACGKGCGPCVPAVELLHRNV